MPDATICHITRIPVSIPTVSGMMPLTAALDVDEIRYVLWWHALQKVSWRLGDGLRRWGIRHYGSEWNGLVPIWDERRKIGNM